MQLRSSIPDLFTERLAFLEDVLFDEYEIEDGVVSQLFKVRDTDKPFVRTTTVASFGSVPIKAEGADVEYDEMAQGYDKTYTPDSYELAFLASKEALDDEQEEVVSDAARALMGSLTFSYNTDHANTFNTGFTSTTGSPDGVALFDTAHPLVGGGTEQNELTTGADLSVGSLQDALNDITDTTDDAGKLITWRPKYLLVPQELEWLARQLIMSPGDPESPNRAANPFKGSTGGGLSVIVWPYLTDADAWFLLAEPSKHNVRTYWRERPNTMHDWLFSKSAMAMKVRARWIRGHSDFRGVYGSPGA